MAASANWCRCTSCHIGYGWKDAAFDFTSETNVDCLACHDATGTYAKFPAGCGHPAYTEKSFDNIKYSPVDLGHIARNVGRTSRQTCGACHFYGGGGDGVKHGDLDSSLLVPDRKLDVHMNAGGPNYACAACHTSFAHDITGRKYTLPAPDSRVLALPDDDGVRIGCENCHSPAPHKHNEKLNDHTDRVACQTCHIPLMARGGIATQTFWDWSTAGVFDAGGREIVRKDRRGNVLYHTKKGDMLWAANLVPEYAWYTGVMGYLRPGRGISPFNEAALNWPAGSSGDPAARIFPFKVHRGRQPLDMLTKKLIAPKLFGPKGSGAFWSDFDWLQASASGMAEYGDTFSGRIGFIASKMYTPLNHMIAPKEDALACGDCHSRTGRLAGLTDFYLPGRDRSPAVDTLGWIAVWLSLCGALLHGVIRFVMKKRRGACRHEA